MKSLKIISKALVLLLVAACGPEKDDSTIVPPKPSNPSTPTTPTEPVEKQECSGVFHLIGDSLVCPWPETSRPKAGWGEKIGAKLSSKAVVNNYALSGRSTKSFIDKGDWAKAVANVKKNDLMLIQFGANDGSSDVDRHTDPYGSFSDNLKKFIDETRAKGGIPVLVTEPCSHSFNSDGTPKHSWGYYPDATRKVATANEAALVDANELTYQWLLELGADDSLPYYMEDEVHYKESGADAVAGIIATALKKLFIIP